MRMIDADKLLKEISETYEYEFPTANGAFDEFVIKILPSIIKNAPTVDAVPVVRCKDCTHNKNSCCEIHSEEPDQYSRGYLFECDDDFFCMYGERREK